ncbi:RNA-binding RNA processing protein NOP9 [Rhodotorula paludigena]|uniref:RNA-binding RNA processing protein NOP9 n=1 Tax=Rhodotorula paludigena TaxID=86838 RepID=UPI00317B3D54
MPRPRQRKSTTNRKEEKRLKREQEEKEAAAQLEREKRARERKTRMEWDALPTASGSGAGGRGGIPDPDALPEPDPDTKAYFKRVSEQIDEMTALRQGKRETQWIVNDDGEEVEEELEDERPLLLRSALESLSGHEVALAGDHETSVVLEQMLYAMDDFAKRVLLDRFTGQFERLVKHRHASHVLQTLFELAGETVDRETRGNVAPAPSSAGDAASDLPTMTALLVSVLAELLPTLSALIYDPFASHCVRILLLVFSGVASSSADPKSRSKKSAQFRKGQTASLGKNWLSDDVSFTKDAKGKGKAGSSSSAASQRFATPSEFADALKALYAALDELDTSGVDHAGHALPTAVVAGEGVRRAALHEVAGPVMRILVELEALQPGGWAPGGWADRVLCGLVSQVAEANGSPVAPVPGALNANDELREEYLAGLLRHPASSPTFEMLLKLAPKPVFDALWAAFFVGKAHRLAANAVANFVVAVGVARLDAVQLADFVKELQAIAQERRGEWIDNYRTGVLRALMESATRLGACEGEVSRLLLDTFGLETDEERKLVVPCVLTLNRYIHWKKLASGATPDPTTQGSVLLQTWLRMHAPHNQVVLDSVTALPFDSLLALSRSATSSHILDTLLTSPTVPPRALRAFIMSLLGHYHTLADDRIGSRVAERCFASADVYLKDKMAQSLFEQQNDLQRSAYAHFFARKLELPLWGRRRDEWKAKMARLTQEEKERARAEQQGNDAPAQAAQAAAPATAAAAEAPQRKKKRERKADEVDEIFASAASGTTAPTTASKAKKARTEDEEAERAAKKARKAEKRAREQQQGMDDVLAAIKASV